jgi:hypothetical protein
VQTVTWSSQVANVGVAIEKPFKLLHNIYIYINMYVRKLFRSGSKSYVRVVFLSIKLKAVPKIFAFPIPACI